MIAASIVTRLSHSVSCLRNGKGLVPFVTSSRALQTDSSAAPISPVITSASLDKVSCSYSNQTMISNVDARFASVIFFFVECMPDIFGVSLRGRARANQGSSPRRGRGLLAGDAPRSRTGRTYQRLLGAPAEAFRGCRVRGRFLPRTPPVSRATRGPTARRRDLRK